jgi:hypothetical protein
MRLSMEHQQYLALQESEAWNGRELSQNFVSPHGVIDHERLTICERSACVAVDFG